MSIETNVASLNLPRHKGVAHFTGARTLRLAYDPSSMARKFAHGIDIIELDRIADVVARHGERFLNRVYTPDEIAHCRGRIPELAARFAAKEAVMKALGTGVRGVGWRDIEVLPNRRGKPLVFAGTVGLIPRRKKGRNLWEKSARPGDLVVMIGGRSASRTNGLPV